MKIFISHPCSGNIEKNVHKVNKIVRYWHNKGYIPIAPHLLFSYMKNDKYRNEIMQICYDLIDACDMVAIYGRTKGCRLEEKYAKMRNKKILHMYEKYDIGDLMTDVKDVIV